MRNIQCNEACIMKKVRTECREYELPYILLLAIYLIIIASLYTISFELPTHRAYYEASFLSSQSINFTELSEILDRYEIKSHRSGGGMNISFAGGLINGSHMYPVDGEIRVYKGDYGKFYVYVEVWLNRTEFPDMSFHDAVETIPLLYATGTYIRDAVSSYPGMEFVSEWNSTYRGGEFYD